MLSESWCSVECGIAKLRPTGEVSSLKAPIRDWNSTSEYGSSKRQKCNGQCYANQFVDQAKALLGDSSNAATHNGAILSPNKKSGNESN
jgi:hypothetical protein